MTYWGGNDLDLISLFAGPVYVTLSIILALQINCNFIQFQMNNGNLK